MAEYKTDKQVNYGFGLSFEATGKAPVIAKRIWATLADAQAYVNEKTDTAIAGLQLSVINDPIESNNGIYFVKSVGNGTDPGVLDKIGGSSVATDVTALTERVTSLETEHTIGGDDYDYEPTNA